MNYLIFLQLCDRMRFEVNCAKSHHRVISDGLFKARIDIKFWQHSPNLKLIGDGAGGAHILVPKDTFMDVFDISCDIGNFEFRAHIFCPHTTQELPKRHYDAGLNNCPKMNCHKYITDTLDTVKIRKRFACAN